MREPPRHLRVENGPSVTAVAGWRILGSLLPYTGLCRGSPLGSPQQMLGVPCSPGCSASGSDGPQTGLARFKRSLLAYLSSKGSCSIPHMQTRSL